MTAKEYLQQYGESVRIAERLKTEYEQELLRIDSVRSTLGGDGTPHGNGINRATESKAIRLADKAHRLKDAELEAVRIRQEVFDTIRDIPNVEGEVLYLRYINLLRWEQVAETMGYSYQGVFNIHRRALEIVEKKLESIKS